MDTLLKSIPALIGLLGVCITLFWNSRADRQARARERQSDHLAIAAAILGELRSNQELLKPYAYVLQKYGSRRLGAPRIKMLKFPSRVTTQIFEVNIPKFGLLESGTIEKTANAYSHLKMFDDYLEWLGGEEREGARRRAGYRSVRLGRNDDALEIRLWIDECIECVDEAITLLKTESKT